MEPQKTYCLDLHEFPVWKAVEIAKCKVAEAWENGCHSIQIIHGSPRIGHWMQARHLKRGGIKWELRGMLSRGTFSEYAYYRWSKKHDISSGYMTLALRKHPSPNDPPVWTAIE